MFKNPLLPLWYLLIQYLQKASIPSPGAAPKSSGSVCGTSTREARASCWSVHIFLESFPDGNHLTAPFPPLLSIPLGLVYQDCIICFAIIHKTAAVATIANEQVLSTRPAIPLTRRQVFILCLFDDIIPDISSHANHT
ncbi:hypothetical protein FPOAC1_002987 [Fusarium poae]|uniref:hypothetical protein n=1 Tax=Fusarium poae TaxID=36050 RepID=UPI001CEB61EE|nr:hypothetical protein FPOAC1_002987 [Fusarium poae]KAG8676976.1 hypothetical protein FPOAC1_002987 [Fusarium poae]